MEVAWTRFAHFSLDFKDYDSRLHDSVHSWT